MKLRFLLIPLLGSLIAAETSSPIDSKKELDKLQGAWAVVSVERDGQPVPQDKTKGWTLTIEGDKYIFKPGDKSIEGIYHLDPTKSPKTIDAKRTNGPEKDKILQGIYSLEGNTLKMCFNQPDKDSRPADFAAPSGSGLSLYVFRR